MSESLQVWMEIAFDAAYLVVVWALTVAFFRNRGRLSAADRPVGELFPWAFLLLGSGDTFHVGARLVGLLRGDLDFTLHLGGLELGAVGIGALATALTVTVFYVLMLLLWRRRSNRPYDWLGWLVMAAFVVRFIILFLPANQWNSTVPVQPWATYRNLPLMVIGWGIVILMLRDGYRTSDRLLQWVGWMIALSYLFYMPVIFWVQQVPALGMLMIPKTLAYLGMGFAGWYFLFRPHKAA